MESEKKKGRPPKADNNNILPKNLKRLYNAELPVEEKKLKGLKCKKASEGGESEDEEFNENKKNRFKNSVLCHAIS